MAMQIFVELCKRSIQRQLTYRTAIVAGLITNFFFGLLRAAILTALYGSRTEVAGITIQGAVTYTGLSQATIGFLSLFSWYQIINSVYSGDVASDLLKPMNYFSLWMAQDLGRAIIDLLLRGFSLMLAYALLMNITSPTGWQWAALVISLFLAWLVSFSWRFLVNLVSFWSPNAIGIGRLFFMLSWFMSGFLMPLRFFPEWVSKICYLTPFPYTVNTVIEVYLGVAKGQALIQALLGQLLWAGILILAGQIVLRAGVRRLVILGG